MLAHQHVVRRLKDIDYLQVAGNRFARGLADIPAGMVSERNSPSPQALIDVLIPAYTSRAHENVQVGEDLFTTEVHGLQLALARPAVTIVLVLHRLNGQALSARRGRAMAALAGEQHLSDGSADERFTRVQALIANVLGPA